MSKKEYAPKGNDASVDDKEMVSIFGICTCAECKYSYLKTDGVTVLPKLYCDYSDDTNSVCQHYKKREVEVIGTYGEHTFTVAKPSPMHLKYTTGCTADSLTVDGKEEIHLTPEQRREAWQKLCHWLARKDGEQLNELLQFVLPQYGTYTGSDEPCECCGDWVTTYDLTIN